MKTAYLVGFINKNDGVHSGVDIFSESTPTCSSRYHSFVITEVGNEDLDKAFSLMRIVISKNPGLEWVKKFFHNKWKGIINLK